jgi:NAD(P)-dependent dehydrogenase (short-subunit alcohol dehydrogenase family)
MSDVKKTVLITGVTRGIGNAIALQMAKDGYAIAGCGTMDPASADSHIKKIREIYKDFLYVQADISKAEDRIRLVANIIEHFGRIDVLVNNAGVGSLKRANILEVTEESFNRVFDINLKGSLFLSQMVAKHMIEGIKDREKENLPLIIFMSSISAYTLSVMRGEYCMSKAAMAMLVKLFGFALAEYGINVYEIRPGNILSDMTLPVKDHFDKLIAGGLHPIRRWGTGEDCALAVSAICKGYLPYSTGAVIDVDGGFHMKWID